MTDSPTCEPTNDTAEASDRERVRILERHCDHLMGQLYHQVGIIRDLREQAAHLSQELDAVRDTPKLLDEALTRVSLLKEELVGRKEVELDLRSRIADLEREERAKVKHIRQLEDYVERLWNSPQGRIARGIKNILAKLTGRKAIPKELERET